MPRSYDVKAFQKRPGTKFWQLETGSKIGYTKIATHSKEHKNPIIYLHGGPGGRITDEIITTLSPLSLLGHDLYFYDQIGSGHSERLVNIQEYTVERHRQDLSAIIETIGSGEVILIGHSWGCLLAINYLQDKPKSVERMILSGPGPILPIHHNLAKEYSPDSLKLRAPQYSNQEGNKKARNIRSIIINKWAYLFGRKLASDKEADDFFTYLNQALSRSTECYADEVQTYEGGAGYYSHIMTVKSFSAVQDKRDQLQQLDIPTLVIRGQCDNQKWGFAKEYLDLLSNSSLEIIADSGHDLIKGDAEIYYQLMDSFLKTNK